MEVLQTLSVALGLAALSGYSLYLTVFSTGLAIHLGWVHLAPQFSSLSVLGDPGHSHCFRDSVRPGIFRGQNSLGRFDLGCRPHGYSTDRWCISGDQSARARQSGFRSNRRSPGRRHELRLAQPESKHSAGGQQFAGTLLKYRGQHRRKRAGRRSRGSPLALSDRRLRVPFPSFRLTFYFLPKIWRSISMNLWFISRKLNQLSGAENIEKLPSKLPSRYDASFRRLTSDAATVAWAVPCVSGKGKYLEPNRFGYLVASNEEPAKVWFITKTIIGSASKMLEIEQFKVSLERRLLFEELNLYSLGKNRRLHLQVRQRQRRDRRQSGRRTRNPTRSRTPAHVDRAERTRTGSAELRSSRVAKRRGKIVPPIPVTPATPATPDTLFPLGQSVVFQNLLGVRLIDSHRRQGDFLLDLFAVHDLQSLANTLRSWRRIQRTLPLTDPLKPRSHLHRATRRYRESSSPYRVQHPLAAR